MYGQGKTRGQVTELKIDTATNQACVVIQIYIFSVEANQFLKTHFKKIYNEIRKLAHCCNCDAFGKYVFIVRSR
jgi:type I restriction enzyme S subunit